jgi:hypothetical protein
MSRLVVALSAALAAAVVIGELAVGADSIPSHGGRGTALSGELIVAQTAAEFGLGASRDIDVRRAVEKYLKEIQDIERRATEAKAEAQERLLEKLGGDSSAKAGQLQPGLIGTAAVDGERTGIAYHYQHGRVFPPELIRGRFHKGHGPLPSVVITLVGYVEVPRDMTVQIWHAAGGVNVDHGELHVSGRVLGKVGDDMAKSVIYVVKLRKGRHSIRWILSGGTFQHNFLKFEDPQTGEVLHVYHDSAQRHDTGTDRATELVEANTAPSEWPKTSDKREWHLEPLELPSGLEPPSKLINE